MESHMMGTAKQKAGEPGNLTVIAQQLNHANHRLPQTSPALKPGSPLPGSSSLAPPQAYGLSTLFFPLPGLCGLLFPLPGPFSYILARILNPKSAP